MRNITLASLRGMVVAFVIVVFGTGCGGETDGRKELLVFAAISVTDALKDVAAAYEAEFGTSILFSFGGSQSLAQQIASGAPADVFISAGEGPLRFLQERELVRESVPLVTNKLVVVSRGEFVVEKLADIGAAERVAIADPDLAPAGAYARESLVALDLWDSLRDSLVYGPDVRATLAYVETGAVETGVVYATDAAVASSLHIFDVVPIDSYTPIEYPAIAIQKSSSSDEAKRFLDYLRGPLSRSAFEKRGFEFARTSQ